VTGDDRDTNREIRRGDPEAFGELVRRYQTRVFGLVLMMVRDAADAEEVTQEAFVRAGSGRPRRRAGAVRCRPLRAARRGNAADVASKLRAAKLRGCVVGRPSGLP
jgi:DNA-directed RNA polymerase specialized sigma24 family protein